MNDYGEIYVRLHKGLSFDQKMSMIRMAVENQLLTANRIHYIEILHHCLSIVNILDDGVPILSSKNGYLYSYTFKLDYY